MQSNYGAIETSKSNKHPENSPFLSVALWAAVLTMVGGVAVYYLYWAENHPPLLRHDFLRDGRSQPNIVFVLADMI